MMKKHDLCVIQTRCKHIPLSEVNSYSILICEYEQNILSLSTFIRVEFPRSVKDDHSAASTAVCFSSTSFFLRDADPCGRTQTSTNKADWTSSR